MELQPYKSHWKSHWDYVRSTSRSSSGRWFKRTSHRLFRRMNKAALHSGDLDRMPYRVYVDDGT